MATIICGYCGENIVRGNEPDTSDLNRGWDHTATPLDMGVPERRATRWHHHDLPPCEPPHSFRAIQAARKNARKKTAAARPKKKSRSATRSGA